jgi:hypothetical protein
MTFGNKTPTQWVNDVPQDQIVTLATALLTRIAENGSLRDQFTQKIKNDTTISRMLTPQHT